MKVLVKPERCKECGLCDAFCPKKAISHADHTNLAGYHPVVIDDEKWHRLWYLLYHMSRWRIPCIGKINKED